MRDYDPTTGRYIQADPLGLVDGASVYGYVSGSPLRYVDPIGLEQGNRGDFDRNRRRHQGQNWGDLGDQTSYFGAEAHFIAGLGVVEVSCIDECGDRRSFLYIKVCGGAAIGASVSLGLVKGMNGARCRPKTYSGPFHEFEASFPVAVGVSADFTPKGDVVEGGLTYGGGAQSGMCYYFFVGETW